LLPWRLGLDASDEFWVVDKGIEELVPAFGGDGGIPEHVGQFIDAVVGLCDWVESEAPRSVDLPVEGAASLSAAVIAVILHYCTADPLG
jgi:hypothetical protein